MSLRVAKSAGVSRAQSVKSKFSHGSKFESKPKTGSTAPELDEDVLLDDEELVLDDEELVLDDEELALDDEELDELIDVVLLQPLI